MQQRFPICSFAVKSGRNVLFLSLCNKLRLCSVPTALAKNALQIMRSIACQEIIFAQQINRCS